MMLHYCLFNIHHQLPQSFFVTFIIVVLPESSRAQRRQAGHKPWKIISVSLWYRDYNRLYETLKHCGRGFTCILSPYRTCVPVPGKWHLSPSLRYWLIFMPICRAGLRSGKGGLMY